MIDEMLDYFNSIYPMPHDLVKSLRELVMIREFEKGDFILKAGNVSNYASWILKGLVRSYHVKDAEEITTKFLWELGPLTSFYSYYSRKPGNENIVALQTLYKTHPEFNFIGRVITEKYLYMLEIEVFYLRKQKTEDRYQYIVKYFPELLQRVPLKYLATYMGMNLETLSRIRAKK